MQTSSGLTGSGRQSGRHAGFESGVEAKQDWVIQCCNGGVRSRVRLDGGHRQDLARPVCLREGALAGFTRISS